MPYVPDDPFGLSGFKMENDSFFGSSLAPSGHGIPMPAKRGNTARASPYGLGSKITPDQETSAPRVGYRAYSQDYGLTDDNKTNGTGGSGSYEPSMQPEPMRATAQATEGFPVISGNACPKKIGEAFGPETQLGTFYVSRAVRAPSFNAPQTSEPATTSTGVYPTTFGLPSPMPTALEEKPKEKESYQIRGNYSPFHAHHSNPREYKVDTVPMDHDSTPESVQDKKIQEKERGNDSNWYMCDHYEDVRANPERSGRQNPVQYSNGYTLKQRNPQKTPSPGNIRFTSDVVAKNGGSLPGLVYFQPPEGQRFALAPPKARVPTRSRTQQTQALAMFSQAPVPTERYYGGFPARRRPQRTHRQQYRLGKMGDQETPLGAGLDFSRVDWNAVREDIERVEFEHPLNPKEAEKMPATAEYLQAGVSIPMDQIPDFSEAPEQPEVMMNATRIVSEVKEDTKEAMPKEALECTPLDGWMGEFWGTWFRPRGGRRPQSSEDFVRIFGAALGPEKF